MSIFGGDGYNDNYCRTCRGTGTLQVRIYNARGRWIRSDPDIICDACDGKRYLKNSAAVAAYTKQPSPSR
jgi:excinuclease UvrABC ATPase subunit